MADMPRQPISTLLATQVPPEGSPCHLEGWVRTRRDSKGFSFLEVNDGSCLANLQVVVDEGSEAFAQMVPATTGASVRVWGQLVPSQGQGQSVEVQAHIIEVPGTAPADYPLQKKRHGFEYLRTIAHLRVRSNTFGAVGRVRNAVYMAVHRFFQERQFMFLPAPLITASDAEGAGEMFRVTTLDAANPPRSADGKDVDWKQDFFGQKAGLSVSGQLEAEVFATAFHSVYTFGPTFRADNSNTSRHASEFWMIEPEVAFTDLGGIRALAEDFIKYVIEQAREACPEDFAFFDQRIEKGLLNKLDHVQNTPFETITYTEAVKLLEASGESFEFPVSWGTDLQSEHERYLTEKKIGRPTFVVDYPRSIKAFYMRANEAQNGVPGPTVAAMDLLVPGVGEIIGGSQREEREGELLGRMAEVGINPQDLWWYMDLRKYGTVPHAGFGVGFERLLMYLTGLSNIRDVIPFPRVPGHVEF